MVWRYESGGESVRVRNANAPAKADAFRNIREILQCAGCREEILPNLPAERSDHRKEAVRGRIPAQNVRRHNGSTGVCGRRKALHSLGH